MSDEWIDTAEKFIFLISEQPNTLGQKDAVKALDSICEEYIRELSISEISRQRDARIMFYQGMYCGLELAKSKMRWDEKDSKKPS